MGCACNRKQPVGYQVIYKGGEATEQVSTLAEVRRKLANSSKGGRHVPIFKK